MTTYAVSGISSEDSQTVKLTKREVEVLTLISEGLDSKSVAELLSVDKRTVDFHLANIFGKLKVENRIQAIKMAMQKGMIPKWR